MKFTKFVTCLAFFYAIALTGTAQTSTKVKIEQNSAAGIFKIIYKTATPEDVKVYILNDKGETIFKEALPKTLSFSRPYNFYEQSPQNFTIVVEDKDGKSENKVSYSPNKVESAIEVVKIANAVNKYLLSVENKDADQIQVKILDDLKNVLYEEFIIVNGKFAVVYNLSKYKVPVTFEVSGSGGALRTFNFK